MPGSKAILGFRPHTGWTTAVALTGTSAAPSVIDRRRIEFGLGEEERFVYHRAEEGSRAKAAAAIAKTRKAGEAAASRAIRNLLADLKRQRFDVRVAVVPTSRTVLPEKLDDILAAHSRIHAAEGAFYRDIAAEACADAGLKVHRVVERDLPVLAEALLPAGKRDLTRYLQDMGKALGPPWSEDQKLATLAAWLHLDKSKHGG